MTGMTVDDRYKKSTCHSLYGYITDSYDFYDRLTLDINNKFKFLKNRKREEEMNKLKVTELLSQVSSCHKPLFIRVLEMTGTKTYLSHLSF